MKHHQKNRLHSYTAADGEFSADQTLSMAKKPAPIIEAGFFYIIDTINGAIIDRYSENSIPRTPAVTTNKTISYTLSFF